MKLDPYGFEGLDRLWQRQFDEKSSMLFCVPLVDGRAADETIHIHVARILHGVERTIISTLAEQTAGGASW